MSSCFVGVQSEPFVVGDEVQALSAGGGGDGVAGAMAFFVGCVRGDDGVQYLQLEHYPGMTEQALTEIASAAAVRWSLLAVRVVHRYGRLACGEDIVFVGVCAGHRGDAFTACQYIVDFLKSRAPFWKKEITAQGERWVTAKATDERAVLRWQD